MQVGKIIYKLANFLRYLADKLYDEDKETPCEACWKIHSLAITVVTGDGCYLCPQCSGYYRTEEVNVK